MPGGRPLGSSVTVTSAAGGAVPVAGARDSQSWVFAAVHVTVPFPEFVTCSVVVFGMVEPTGEVSWIWPGLTASPGASTFSVTDTRAGLPVAPGAVTVIVPW